MHSQSTTEKRVISVRTAFLLLVGVLLAAGILVLSPLFFEFPLTGGGASAMTSMTATTMSHPTTGTPRIVSVSDIMSSPATFSDRYVTLRGRVYFHSERGEIVMDDGTGIVRLEFPCSITPLIGAGIVVEGYVRWLGGKSMPYVEVTRTYGST